GSTRQNLAKAIELFTKALVLDPGSGQAKALTSGALALRVLDQLSNAPAADLERAWLLAGEAQFSSGNAALVNFIKWQILRAQRQNARLAGPHAWRASALALVGETKRARRELERAMRLGADGRYSSICRFRELECWSPKLNQMAETTFFAGLRKAGVPEN